MAYRRGYRKRRRYGRRYGRRPYRLGRRVRKVERKVRRINRSVETKVLDFFTDGEETVNNSAKYFGFLDNINQGTGRDERIGTKIKITSIHFRYYLKGSSQALSSSDFWNTARVWLVVDKQPRVPGTPPSASSQIFQTTDYIGTIPDATAFVLTPYNWENRGRYKILYDKVHYMSTWATTTAASYWTPMAPYFRVYGKKYKKMNLIVHYDDDGNAVIKNALWLGFYANSTALPSPSMQLCLRVRYQDL